MKKKVLLCVGLLLLEAMLFGSIFFVIGRKKAEEARYFYTENEYLQTIDCVELFDSYPNYSFLIEFEICAKTPGTISVYQYSDPESKYSFIERIQVTEEYQKFSLVVVPVLENVQMTTSYLSFYGEYGTGIIPTVRDLSIVPIEKVSNN